MKKVKGYIGKSDTHIYYAIDNDVYRATHDAITDCLTGYLQGRWECSLIQFNQYRDSVFSFVN